LTRHLTTRADDSHAAPVLVVPRRAYPAFTGIIQACQAQVGSARCFELNHMLHRLCEPPSISLSFSLATVLPRRSTYTFRYTRDPMGGPRLKGPPLTPR